MKKSILILMLFSLLINTYAEKRTYSSFEEIEKYLPAQWRINEATLLSQRNNAFSIMSETELSETNFREITVPFHEVITLDENAVDYNGSKTTMLQFTLTDTLKLYITMYLDSYMGTTPQFDIFENNLTNKIIEKKYSTLFTFNPGNYYILIYDNDHFAQEGVPFSFHFSIRSVVDKIEYSQIETGIVFNGNIDINTPVNNVYYYKGFYLPVEAGKKYIINYAFYAPESTMAIIQEINIYQNKKNISTDGYISEDVMQDGSSFSFIPTTTDTIQIQMQIRCDDLKEITYSMQISEEEITLITLSDLLNGAEEIPYTNNLSFTTNGFFKIANVTAGDELLAFDYEEAAYAMAYKINLNAEDTVKVHIETLFSGNNVHIYKENEEIEFEETHELISYELNSKNEYKKQLSAGKYYIVISTNNSNNTKNDKFYLTLWNIPEEPENDFPTELINKITDITEESVTYSNNLSMNYIGEFTNKNQHKRSAPVTVSENEYHKIFHIKMNTGDSINISYMHEKYSIYADVYKKTDENTFELINSYNSYISLFSIASEEGGEYYLDIFSKLTGAYSIKIWAVEKPLNEEVEQLHISKSFIELKKNASEADILNQLFLLNITGTTTNGYQVNIQNNPYSWSIENDRAIFKPLTMSKFYTYTDNVSATVNLTFKEDAEIFDPILYTIGKRIIIEQLSAESKITIYNLNGQNVFKNKITGTTYEVTLPQSGIYLIHINEKVFKVMVK